MTAPYFGAQVREEEALQGSSPYQLLEAPIKISQRLWDRLFPLGSSSTTATTFVAVKVPKHALARSRARTMRPIAPVLICKADIASSSLLGDKSAEVSSAIGVR
jgi:hypothetical protein